MFGIKTYIKDQTKRVFLSYHLGKFPERAISPLSQKIFLYYLVKQLKNYSENVGISALLTKPNKIAVTTWQKLLPYIANNLGNWSTNSNKPHNIATQLEKEVILKMINLYHAEKENIEGYITSGGTEGNIFSAWIGRKYLEQYTDKNKICLLRNDLVHYSVTKAADIVGIKDCLIPLDEKTWSTNIISLDKLIIQLYRKGLRGFLIPITLGYTVGGTNDDLENIIRHLHKIKKGLKAIHFFCWIDAALQGLVEPFLNKRFKPFYYPEISTFIVDFHKFAGVPFPAGLILYRKKLRKLIEKDIPYLTQKDNTLLGSRTGIAPAAIWTTIHFLGRDGFNKIIFACLQQKQEFLVKLSRIEKDVRIITDKDSVAVAVITKNKLSSDFCQKYGLNQIKYHLTFENGKKIVRLYKLFFLPRF